MYIYIYPYAYMYINVYMKHAYKCLIGNSKANAQGEQDFHLLQKRTHAHKYV